MPRLAIVISDVGHHELLERTLVSVLQHRPSDTEVVVALERPYADPYDLRDEVRFVEPTAKATTPGGRINLALSGCRAPFVHLLASGCEVTEDWADEAMVRFGDRQIASIAPLVRDANEHIFAAGVGYTRGGQRYLVAHGQSELTSEYRSQVLGPASFAGFYRKAALDFVGGLSTQLGARQLDVDLSLVLRAAGFTTAVAPQAHVLASAEIDRPESPARQALHDERLFWRNLPSAGKAGALASHSALVAGEFLRSAGRPRMLTQLVARWIACCQLGSNARHRRAIASLSQRAVRSKPINNGQRRIDAAHASPTPAAEGSASRLSTR